MDFFANLFNASSVPQLDAAQVHDRVTRTPRPFLLDVRNPDEYKQAHIQGAELIPLPELSAKLSRVPKNREVICVCASGSRSSVAARRLSSQGYQVSNLRGGMSQWLRAGLPVKSGMAK